MKSETVTVHGIYQDRRQYRVPFYQRHYVWNEEEQWSPLWDDVQAKAEARLADPENSVPHFLGAIVLEPQPTDGLIGVQAFNVIDGQQRLTTLQYLIAAIAMAAREREVAGLVPVLEGCLWNANPEMMKNPATEIFKLWPTFSDRSAFALAMKASTREALRAQFASSFTQNETLRKIGVDHPPALEAIWYFRGKIDAWLMLADNVAAYLEKLAEAVLKDLKIVSITLEQQDDAQVIFETLNGRGAQLHPSDLIRNFIFMKADEGGAEPQHLFDTLWCQFEDNFWSEEQRRGRLKRPRREWFFQSTLQAELGEEVDVGRLYQGYRTFAKQRSAEAQLQTLSTFAAAYRNFLSLNPGTPIGWFGSHINVWDASPAHSIALAVALSPLAEVAQRRIFSDLISYVVRRAICGLSNKSYNKIFLQLLKRTRREHLTPESIRAALKSLQGEASRWPTDRDLEQALLSVDFMSRVGETARVRYVLTALEGALRTDKSEEATLPTLEAALDVEHILPQNWLAHWPVDGTLVTKDEHTKAVEAALFRYEDMTPRQRTISRRHQLKDTIGNLTMLNYGLNRSLQDKDFKTKREGLFKHSNLHLNRKLMIAEVWDEDAIEQRGRELFQAAVTLWPSP